MERGSPEDALKASQLAVRKFPIELRILALYCKALQRTGNYEKAISATKQGLRFAPTEHSLWTVLADCYFKLGDFTALDALLTAHRKVLKTITVDDLMSAVKNQLKLPIENIDTLLMDVQGAEHLVVKGAEWTLRKIKYVYCEVSFGGLYHDDMQLEEFQNLMKDYGFRMYFLLMGRKGWGEALFVREEIIIG